MNIVWFKRDLRIEDHEALAMALQNGPMLPLYILEPELWQQPDMSQRHYLFLVECIYELDASLRALGQKLIIKKGNAVDVLDELFKHHNIDALWSHQETWNGWTYKRDKTVRNLCAARKIKWNEPAQNGVIRALKNRNGWSERWYERMSKPTLKSPIALSPIKETSDTMPNSTQLGLKQEQCIYLQKGGRAEGLKILTSFLDHRGENYTKEMSSPVTAFDSCSLLSAHIAFGTVSIREVFHACERRKQEVKQMPRGMKGKWPSALRSFSGRLRWHCHFIQKLEDEPEIEFQNMHSAYDGLRENNFNTEYFQRWQSGNTGYPMVDACMRALNATGWLNFRMRAMLVSFASYHLWLHWSKPALHLAQQFTDYEPGIHYSQIQMQSGTTGINAIRIYNPIKQGIDQDPNGVFIRQWIPELQKMDQAFIHTPWQAQSQMNDYPMPIVDEKTSRKLAANGLYSRRENKKVHRKLSTEIIKKHASRKPHIKRRKTLNKNKQRELPF